MTYIWKNIPEIVLIVHIIFIAEILFVEKKRSDTTIAWILTLVFLPVIGPLLYMFIGTTRIHVVEKKFIKKQHIDYEYQKVIEDQLNLIKYRNPEGDELDKFRDMIMMNLKSAGSLYTNDNDVKLFLDAKDKYESLFFDIENAKSHIHIMYYIFNDDKIGNELIDLLCKKVSEGVEVRLVYDGFGNIKTKKKAFSRLEKAGGEVIRFLPGTMRNLLRVNYRNHRKIVVIDGKIGYVGGINIGDEYLGGDKKRFPWRDTHVRICGTSIVTLQHRFLSDWSYLSKKDIINSESAEKYFTVHPTEDGQTAVQIVSSGPDSGSQQIKYGILKMMHEAKRTLYIQTPYFIPDDSFLDALKMAVASGVDVKVMIPNVPDKKFVYYVTLSYVEELLKSGVKVYAYDGFLHSKTVVVDSEVATVGSMNMDIRGFLLAFELNAFVYDKDFAASCEEAFRADLLNCKEISYDEFKKRGFFRKFLEALFRILAPLM